MLTRTANHSLLLAALFAAACAPPSGYGEEGATGDDLGEASSGLSVGGAVNARCSTISVFALSQQLIDEIQCLRPNQMKSIEGFSRVSMSDATFPYLQTSAANALQRAIARRSGTLVINSALRSLPAQYLLYRWYRAGRCNIGDAAPPGGSNHEVGLALDVDNYDTWRAALQAEGFRWYGAGDEVHFDYVAGGDSTNYSVLAFQRLWNRNNPSDRIAEDGDYGPATESRLARAPSEGFRIGATCGTPNPPPTTIDPIEVFWSRNADGSYALAALAPSRVTRVRYRVDGFQIAEVARTAGENFPGTYRFTSERNERQFEVLGYDAAGTEVGRGYGLLDVTAGQAVYIRQMAARTYEIGLERASNVASIEVRAESFLLTDSVSGTTKSTRNAVRYQFNSLGTRQFEIRTFGANGALLATIRRSYTLR